MRVFWVAVRGRHVRLRRACRRADTIAGGRRRGCWRWHYLQHVGAGGEFVKLRGRGARPEQAMHAVNANAREKRACGVAAIAYIRDHTMGTVKLQDELVQIVRINVVAGFNGSSWERVSDMVQYAVLEGGGESI